MLLFLLARHRLVDRVNVRVGDDGAVWREIVQIVVVGVPTSALQSAVQCSAVQERPREIAAACKEQSNRSQQEEK